MPFAILVAAVALACSAAAATVSARYSHGTAVRRWAAFALCLAALAQVVVILFDGPLWFTVLVFSISCAVFGLYSVYRRPVRSSP